MYFINSRKKINFSFSVLLIVLLFIASITFGTINSSANSTDNQPVRETKLSSDNLQGLDFFRKDSNSFIESRLEPFFDTAATFTVTNLNDAGTGSLRKAVADANSAAGDDTIMFQTGLTGTVTLTGGEILINSNITITGAGQNVLTVSGNNASRVFNIAANAVVSISNITVSSGRVEGSGGGILNAGTLNLTNGTVSDNNANYTGTTSGNVNGGGISNAGTLNLLNTTVKNNTARVINLGTASGGGLSNTGTATLTNSTVSSNNSIGKPNAFGGGISNSGTLTVTNSTVGNNSATASSANSIGQGGGIFNAAQGALTIRNSTIGFNTANAVSVNGGGIYNTTGTVRINNTIVSDNNAINTDTSLIRDVSGSVISEGDNLISNTTGSSGWIAADILNQPSLITPLGNYGGPTQTFGLLPNSQAINAGNNANAPPTDQRGAARIVGGTIDIGAFENSVTGVLTAIPNVAVGAPYNQTLPTSQPSPFTFTLADGALPPGITLSSSGVISGMSTAGGTFNFTVAVTASNGMVGFKQYTLVVNCTFSLNPPSQSFTSAGGNSSISVIADNGCSYTIFTNNASWITVTTSSVGSGNTSVGFSVAANTGPARMGSITIAGLTFIVNQAVGCTYSLPVTSASITDGGGNGSFNVVTESGCPWAATSNVPWITINSGSGSGNGAVSFTVQPNTGAARSGTITVGGQTFTVNQAPGCSYSISPTNISIEASGGTGNFSISSLSSCPWTAVSNVPWITITSGSSGSGNGTVSFSVTANTGIVRTGTITAGGLTFTVNQASGCSYSLSATTATFTETGGNGSVNVTSGSSCTWTAVSNVSWITVTSGGSGTSNGAVNFTVAANTGPPRTGTLTIAGLTFTVTQASGCSYSLSATTANFSETGGTGSVNVTAGSGCTWTAISNATWITVTSGGSGTGNGTVNFTVAPNTGAARTGTITIAGQTFTVTQAFGCAYILSSNGTNFSANGGSGSFNVTSNTGCTWTAISNVSWITIISGSANGNGAVSFSVQANVGPARTGTISVNGQTYTINQSIGCVYSLSSTGANVPGNGGTGNFNLNVGAGCEWIASSNAAWLTITSPASGNVGSLIIFSAQANTGAARSGIITVAGQTFTVNQAAATAVRNPVFDFDGDGKADISVFRPNGGNWYILGSQNGFFGAQFGDINDKIVPADYDGDGRTDLAVYRNGTWYLQRSTAGFLGFAFGDVNDIPQPADFDGDGKAELAVWRPSNGVWYVYNLVNNQFTAFQFGAGTDKPVVGDYDGDSKADYAVYRPSNGTWYLQRSSLGFTGMQFGDANDKPVAADYDGDGKTDIAVFRPSNGTWYLQRSQLGFTGMQFGIPTDLPTPADYDGDGKADIAVFRSGTWYLQRSTAGFTGIGFGANTDKPAPNAFIP